MISSRLLAVARCPDCRSRLTSPTASSAANASADARTVVCAGCGRDFGAARDFLDLRPAAAYTEQTKYLDHDLHADARHASIAPPVLGSKIRNDMLRRMLAPGRGDRVVDLGCGSGRAIAWNVESGAAILGVDISPFFAAEAVAHSDLILGDLRRLPLADGAFNKAWSLDVFEHLSPEAFRDVLAEANRVLEPNGALFMYTHVRQNGWPAVGVRLVNRLARLCERAGLLDLRQERLRKSDHLNPIADHGELDAVARSCGFAVERRTYYSPVMGAFVENILARMAERALARRAGRASGGDHSSAAGSAPGHEAIRVARADAQARVRQGGALYRALVAVTAVMKLDLLLFGHVPSGPFFALLRKVGPATSAVGPAAETGAAGPR